MPDSRYLEHQRIQRAIINNTFFSSSERRFSFLDVFGRSAGGPEIGFP